MKNKEKSLETQIGGKQKLHPKANQDERRGRLKSRRAFVH